MTKIGLAKLWKVTKLNNRACSEGECGLEHNAALTALLFAGIEMTLLPAPPTQAHSHIVMNRR